MSELSAEPWSAVLTEALDCPVAVEFGRSRTVPLQARSEVLDGRPGLRVRMHRMFRDAPPDVRAATAKWLRSGRRARRAGATLDEWIRTRLEELPAPARAVRLRPRGTCYDLDVLAAPLLASEFAGDFDPARPAPARTWGPRRASRSRHSLRLGSFDVETHVVRVHPVLDQAGAPEWFVRFVLMHELLHAVLPPRRGADGRWVHHSREFRERERSFADYRRAREWEEHNLPRLIASARHGSRLRVRREDRAPEVRSADAVAKPALLRWVQRELFGSR